MQILITGGAGFIGSHTADALLARGHAVRVLDSLEEPVHRGGLPPSYLDPAIDLVQGDVRDEGTLLAAMRGCDAIYHLAAYQDYLPTFSKFFSVNVTSTALMYELIHREKLPVQKVIVASSQATLGEGLYRDAEGREVLPNLRTSAQLSRGVWEIQPEAGQVGPLTYQRTSELVANPQNPYGMSKIAEEQVTLNLGRRCDVPSVAMRYSIVQGPRQSFYNAYSGACRLFCLSFHLGKEPMIYEDGKQVRDYVNIQDVVDANVLVLEDSRADYEMFHVGGGQAVTVIEFAEAVARIFGNTTYKAGPCGKYRFGDTRHIFSDISKLQALGWSPKRTIEDSVHAYRNWLLEEDVADDILEYSNRQMASLGVVRDVESGAAADRTGSFRNGVDHEYVSRDCMRAKALVLAAGLGTRLQPLTNTIPKCLVDIGGRPLLGYWIRAMGAAGVLEATVNTHHLHELVRSFLDEASAVGPVRLEESYEPELLGSAGTIANNPNLVDDGDHCLIIYADNLSDVDLGEMLAFHQAHRDPMTMLLFRTTRPEACGIASVDEDHRVTEFEEKPQNPKSNLANAGVYVVSADAYREIAAMGAFDLGFDVLPKFIGRMRGFEHTGYHFDIGDLDALTQARADVSRVFGEPE